MPLPDEDVAIITGWVAALSSDMPAHVADQLKYRAEANRNAITLFECRPMEVSSLDGDWFEVPFARPRFTRSRGWELFYADRNSKFHVYDLVEPTDDVSILL